MLTLLLTTAVACGGVDAEPDGGVLLPDASGPDANTPDGALLDDGPFATIDTGRLMGVAEDELIVFRGVPYAAPPIGPLRFRPPTPHAAWAGTRSATEFGPACPQQDDSGVVGDEDCLTLNVWAFADRSAPRPVMLFIHGGGFKQGSSSAPMYEGSSLARSGGVIVITINYRLGGLGFLATESLASESGEDSAGNYGFRDQVAALGWVQRNVAAFGGDPSNVTIFGESAGAFSVCGHLGSSLSAGLFHRAIHESGGGCYSFGTLRTGTEGRPSAIGRSAEIVGAVGCAGAADELACLRTAPFADVVRATSDTASSGLLDIGPNIDGVVFTDQPFDQLSRGEGNDVPLMTGSNADEGNLLTTSLPIPTEAAYETLVRAAFPRFADQLLTLYPVSDYDSPKAAYVALYSDFTFICPSIALAKAASGGAPTFAYHFTKTLEGPRYSRQGATHGIELLYIFDTAATIRDYTPSEADARVVTAIQTAWTTFARDGSPMSTPSWLPYDPAVPYFQIFGDPVTSASSIRNGRCAELTSLGVLR